MENSDSSFWEETNAVEVQKSSNSVDLDEKYAGLRKEAEMIRRQKHFKDDDEVQTLDGSKAHEGVIEEKVYLTSFGSIRLDSMNQLSDNNGGVDMTSSANACVNSIVAGSVSFQKSKSKNENEDSGENVPVIQESSDEDIFETPGQENYIEDYFFQPPPSESDKLQIKNLSYSSPSDLNEVDKIYFRNSDNHIVPGSPKSAPLDKSALKGMNIIDQNYFGDMSSQNRVRTLSEPPTRGSPLSSAGLDIQSSKVQINESKFNSSSPKTAYDYIRMYRTAKQISNGEVDMKDVLENNDKVKKLLDMSYNGLDENGERNFTKLWHNLRNEPREIVLSVLKENVIYNEGDLLALNKPYGMAVHGTAGDHKDLSLVNYLDEFAKMMKVDKLYTVHRLDRNTTGILLLAKTQSAAKKFHDFFQEGVIIRRYLAITKGVPQFDRGIIEIPMRECIVDGRERMGVQYVAPGERAKIKVFDAVTQFKVLSKCLRNTGALLLVKPETGFKHQIRVHLGLGLGCPVLGDHKYSHIDSFKPQRLTEDLLKSLKIRQAAVRTMPMFLHAAYVAVPFLGPNGRNLVLKSAPPPLFRKVMKWMGLRSGRIF
ncbi:uncharacterized protein LOC136033935 [Artemia franciscana]|uniref:Pseudouridylate synthase RPUSD4, mitochondrial n=1 Tax=Artemia franciscana TaxID=6661 RepID=A0AA88IBK3_ARTSF|nr:hypothetical protein QYM36_002014 [Artemia franciscana]